MAIDLTFVTPILCAMAAGGLIGAERTYHGHPAGFRTHILVCLTACVLMLAAMHQAVWSFLALPGQTVVIDPTRMPHGVLTGIGFLCAGVIFREGFSVHGLTTAASLWTTSAIGLLFGAGMTQLALMAAGATLTVLALLRLLDARIPSQALMDVTLRWSREATPREQTVRAVLAEHRLKTLRIGHVVSPDGSIHEHHVKARGLTPMDIDALADRLAAEPGLKGFALSPRDE